MCLCREANFHVLLMMSKLDEHVRAFRHYCLSMVYLLQNRESIVLTASAESPGMEPRIRQACWDVSESVSNMEAILAKRSVFPVCAYACRKGIHSI